MTVFDPRPHAAVLTRCFERLMDEQGVEWVREDPSTDNGDHLATIVDYLATIVVMDRHFTMRSPSSNVRVTGFWWEVSTDRWRATFHTVLRSQNERVITDFVFSGSPDQFEHDLVLLRLADSP